VLSYCDILGVTTSK